MYIAIHALQGQTEFDSSNFNHPHLPIYMMLGLGKILIALGQTEKEVLIGARVLSAVLVGLTVVLAYLIPRRMGYNVMVAGLSGLLLLSVSEMSQYGRFAHNDTFVTFFSTLTIFFLIEYKTSDHRGWLYAAFFAAGLAVSSKYIAITSCNCAWNSLSVDDEKCTPQTTPCGFWRHFLLEVRSLILATQLGHPRRCHGWLTTSSASSLL